MNLPVNLAVGAVVCTSAKIIGNVTIGENTIIHPKCLIECAPQCEIQIGSNNIIEECVHISFDSKKQKKLLIGDNNHFGVRCKIMNPQRIGSRNSIQADAVVEEGVAIQDMCCVGMRCKVKANTMLSSNSVVFGSKNEITNHRLPNSTEESENHVAEMKKHIQFLKETLPNNHQVTIFNAQKGTPEIVGKDFQ